MPIIDLLASSPVTFVGASVVLGLAVGSFLNVVIYRLPIMLERQWRQQCAELNITASHAQTVPSLPRERFDLVQPRSTCPKCKAPITAWQNIPLFSWAFLGGRCARCGQRISVRYPLVEALTGLLTGALAWRYGFGWIAFAGMVLTWYLIALTFIDVDHQLLPDTLTLPLLWLGLLLALWSPPNPVDLRSSVLGAVIGYVSLWGVYHAFRLLTGKEGMGYGDFKLFAALGAWLGWQMLIPIILVAAVTGSVVGIAMLSLHGKNRSTPIPFGPFLASAGWLVTIIGQEPVARQFGFVVAH